MSSDFKQLLSLLKKRNISVDEYLEFLTHCYVQEFDQLTKKIRKQKYSSRKYYRYLEKNLPHSSHSAATRILTPSIEQLGSSLLSASRIEVAELNKMLQEIPREELTPRNLLHLLLKKRKIRVDEFLNWDQKDWSLSGSSESIYRLKEDKEQIAFYREAEEGSKTFGNYQILEELARGGMGIVYKAYHPLLNQTFALKVLRAGEDASDDALKRFHREIQTVAKLKHPGIIQIIGSGQEKGQHYFVMEFVDGVTLEHLIQKKIPIRRGLLLIKKTLEALSYAHSQGVIHRDLKPSNILVDKDDNPKIGDFGLAKNVLVDKASQKLTHSGAVIGTPRYMSPEQVQGDHTSIDNRSDLYSLAVCLYELLAHRCPFEAPSYHQLFHKILNVQPKPPSRYNASVHRDLDAIVLKALDKNKVQRYQTAKSFALDLERFLDGYLVHAKSVSLGTLFFNFSPEKKKTISAFLSAILLCLFLLVYFQWEQYTRNRQQILSFLKQAEQETNASKKLTPYLLQQREKKTQHLLNALNILNQGLGQYFGQSELEQMKWKTIKDLLPLAYLNESYLLAEYGLKELEQLSFVKKQVLQELQDEYKIEKNKQRQKHLAHFEEWLEQGNNRFFSKAEQEDFLFEVSQMREKEIFQKLLQLLEQGTHSVITGVRGSPQRNQLYQMAVRALGRLGNPQANTPLEEALTQITEKVSNLHPSSQKKEDLNYMVLLAQALGRVQGEKSQEVLDKARWKMGQHTLFWNRTEHTYRKMLLKNAIQDDRPLETADAYNNRGKQKYEQGALKEALADFEKALELDPSFGGAYLNRGNTYYLLGDLPKSIEDYTELLKLEPDNKIGYSNRANSQHYLGNYKEAVQDCTEAIRIDPYYDDAYYGRANAYYMNSELEEARKDFNYGLELNPKDARMWVGRGTLNDYEKKYEDALADFNEAITLDPQYYFAYYKRGFTWSKKKEFQRAIDDFDQSLLLSPNYASAYYERGKAKYALKDFNGALLDYQQAFQLDPKYVNASFEIAYVKYDLKDYQGSIEAYDKTLELDPKYAIAYFNRALAKEKISHLEEAIEDLTQSIHYDPKYVNAYKERGRLKSKKNDFESALEDCEQALKINPQYANGYHQKGLILNSQKKYTEALLAFEEAFKIDPSHVEACFYIGFIKYDLKDYDGSLVAYNETLRLDPTYSYAYFNRAFIKKNQKNWDGAIYDLTQSLRYNVDDPSAYYERGIIKSEQGDYKGAILDYSFAIRYNAENSRYYEERGKARKEINEYEGALQDYTKALEFKPEDPVLYRLRGNVKSNKGDFDEAMADFNKAIQLDANYSLAYINRAFLKKKQQDLNGAIQDFNKAIELNPEDIEAYYDRGTAFQDAQQSENAKKDFIFYLEKTKNSQDSLALDARQQIFKLYPDLKTQK